MGEADQSTDARSTGAAPQSDEVRSPVDERTPLVNSVSRPPPYGRHRAVSFFA